MKNIINSHFQERFGSQPQVVVKAPGRINIIGEHIDYNNGFVMPCAIDKAIYLGMGQRNDNKVVIYSIDFDAEFVTEDLNQIKIDSSHWSSHVVGVLQELINRGYQLSTGLNICFGGDIPIGAGVSSSAGVEVGIALGTSILFDFNITKKEIALIAQATEHKYIGVNCGIMDMYASIFSRQGHILVLDCEALTHQYISADFENYKFILVDTGVKHSLAGTAYNDRRIACEDGLNYFKKFKGIKSFRDLTENDLLENKAHLSNNVLEKCLYVVQEISRVRLTTTAINNQDFVQIGNLMYQTHQGLSKLFDVSCAELDFLAEAAMNLEGVLGSRMHGGGFGGCTINLINKNFENEIVDKLDSLYQKQFGRSPQIISVNISDGATII